eukprot:TRINITY_DN3640_c0_g1_i1.p2 TRINITY_DN3640_c0_g1~~TRINITY_DN3640_c0_g1_i1.p2  ORF type:complete len:65 (+),score=7.59 TRINITY_DN3640_c0_g1_i1:258-452(+)
MDGASISCEFRNELVVSPELEVPKLFRFVKVLFALKGDGVELTSHILKSFINDFWEDEDGHEVF